MINILNLFSWVTWLVILLSIITIFWLIYGGKNEYEFIGVKPLTTKSLFGDIKIPENNAKIYQAPVIYNMKNKPSFDNEKPCKGEEIVAEILEKILASKVQRNIRPGFLKNPETGKNLELDCYNEEYAIAVEYNGIQHYKYPSPFHNTEKEFLDQVYRDRLKKKLCDEAGVYLISVPYWVDNYGSEDGHLAEKTGRKKNLFVSRDVKYKRLYDYLYEKILDYFKVIFPEEYEESVTEDEEYPESIDIDEDEETEYEDDELSVSMIIESDDEYTDDDSSDIENFYEYDN